MFDLISLLLWIGVILSLVFAISRPGRCPACNSRDLDYEYHGFKGDRPVCRTCGWDYDKEQHVADDLERAFKEVKK